MVFNISQSLPDKEAAGAFCVCGLSPGAFRLQTVKALCHGLERFADLVHPGGL